MLCVTKKISYNYVFMHSVYSKRLEYESKKVDGFD